MKSASPDRSSTPFVAIACGGTGGHLFPGMAVGEQLLNLGCEVALLVSAKEVDQQAVRSVVGMEVVTLPAVALERRQVLGFARGFWVSWRQARTFFRRRRPQAVLAMGGFTSAPPVLAGIGIGARTVIHEANSIPGRANRWLAPWVNEALVYFPDAVTRLNNQNVIPTGMPVRPEFTLQDPGACRLALGLHPDRPVLLVMGGSQGASGINDLVLQALPELLVGVPNLQVLHLTGTRDVDKVKAAVSRLPVRALVRPFLTEMELALGAATVAVSRSGASSIAEMAALRVPSVLIPFPASADDHQYFNALALSRTGAAVLTEQRTAEPLAFASALRSLIEEPARREALQRGLAAWHRPDAAELVARRVLARVVQSNATASPTSLPPARLETALL